MMTSWLQLSDLLLTLLHLVIIGFNLLGWIWKRTRRLHLAVVVITAFCWFVLGIWFGWGYCPITDCQWQIKEKLGEHNLPNSFIKYYADKLSGHNISASLIDMLTAGCFFAATLLSVYLNFFRRKGKR
jgi:ABC-type multidrug transport system permease subunit